MTTTISIGSTQKVESFKYMSRHYDLPLRKSRDSTTTLRRRKAGAMSELLNAG